MHNITAQYKSPFLFSFSNSAEAKTVLLDLCVAIILAVAGDTATHARDGVFGNLLEKIGAIVFMVLHQL